jgi:hypothetical protein
MRPDNRIEAPLYLFTRAADLPLPDKIFTVRRGR